MYENPPYDKEPLHNNDFVKMNLNVFQFFKSVVPNWNPLISEQLQKRMYLHVLNIGCVLVSETVLDQFNS